MDISKSKGLELLPDGYPEEFLPPWVPTDHELARTLSNLEEPYRRSLLWTIAAQHAFQSQQIAKDIPGFRFASYGFADPVYEEDAFGVLAYTVLMESDEREKRWLELGKIGLPIFMRQSREILHAPPQIHPANGTSTCWAQSEKAELAGQTGLLTAQHLFTGGDEAYHPPVLGSSVLTTHGEASLIDIGPGGQGGIDAALVQLPPSVSANIGQELVCQNFIAPWIDVTVYGRSSGPIETKVNEVSSSFGSLDYRIPLRVFLATPGDHGDSGALVTDSNGLGIGIYMGGMFIKTTHESDGRLKGHLIGLCQHLGQAMDVMQLKLFR